MEPFGLPYFREAAAEIVLLAVPCGLIGTWVVLRDLAFHSHAVGTATFPGLVLAEGIGFASLAGAFAAAAGFTVFSTAAGRSDRSGSDVTTALALVAGLALGTILASDVFGSGASVDTLLFGSLLTIGATDLWLAAGAGAAAVLVSRLCGHRWLAGGFDPGAAGFLRADSAWLNATLLATVALVVVASLPAVGALLISALIVIPAATVRLFAGRIRSLQAAAIALVVIEGVFGLWLSALTDAPPGATVAVTAGLIFLLALAAKSLAGRRRAGPVLAAAASLLVLASLAGYGAGRGGTAPAGNGPRVVATTTQAGDLARTTGGRQIRLTTVLHPGTDPHEYEPRPSDVRAFADADLVVISGGSLDEWALGMIRDSGSRARVVDLGARLPVRRADDGKPDPHWWQDPVNAGRAARVLATAFTRQNPAAAGSYGKRATRFRAESRRLAARITACLAEIPRRDRKIVTDHDAFTHFTARFGITTVGAAIPALSAGAAPSAGGLAGLERTIHRERVRVVFPERAASAAVIEAVARDTGARVAEPLYGDSLGAAGSAGATLLGSIRANADSVIRGMSDGRIRCFGGRE